MKSKLLLLKILLLSLLFFIIVFIFACQQYVMNPAFLPEENNFVDFVDIEISCSTSGAKIIYTLNGTNPSYQNGIEYTEPIHLTQTTTIKAFAYKEGMLDSSIVSKEFTITKPIEINEDEWIEANIDSGETLWYSFNTLTNLSYEILWDDAKDGSSSYTSDIKVSSYKENLKDYFFLSEDSGYTQPPAIYSENQQKIYIKIETIAQGGTFKIKFNKTTTRYTNTYDNLNFGLTENFAPNESYTFMMYMDGDNDLEKWMIYDFLEIVNGLNGLNNTNIKVVVLLDRIADYDDTNFLGETSNWTGARLYQMNQDGTYSKKTNGWFTDGQEINMGDPNTLKSFISYCKTNYLSLHYVLFLFNHGSGTRTASDSLQTITTKKDKAVCWDVTNSNDWLFDYEVKDAINDYFDSVNKLDLLCYHACLMGSIEVAYELKIVLNILRLLLPKDIVI